MSHRRTLAVGLLLLLLANQDACGRKLTRGKTKFSKPKTHSVASSVQTKLKGPAKNTANLRGSSSSVFSTKPRNNMSRNGSSALGFSKFSFEWWWSDFNLFFSCLVKDVIVDSMVAVSKDMRNQSANTTSVIGNVNSGANILFQWSSHSVLITLLMALCQQ